MSFSITYLVNDEALKHKIEGFLQEWRNPSLFIDTATSGSTGNPKTIRINKKQMIASALMTGEYLNIKKGENALLNLSVDTIAGKMMVIRAIVLELNLLVTSITKNPFTNYQNVPKIDFIALVPYQVDEILKQHGDELKKIKNIIIGGATCSEKLIESLKNKKIQAYQTFGMTETISHIAMRRIGLVTDDYYSTLPNVFISVNSNHQLIIDATNLGVKNLLTNDIIELISENSFIWKGRADFIINSGGVKIHPEKIEQILSKYIEVPFFVSSRKDELLGEKIILVIESSNQLKLDLVEIFKGESNYFKPKEVIYLNKFERTISNKINRIETLKKI
jgi:O-succinylbenzoic acid--CoA ligase